VLEVIAASPNALGPSAQLPGPPSVPRNQGAKAIPKEGAFEAVGHRVRTPGHPASIVNAIPRAIVPGAQDTEVGDGCVLAYSGRLQEARIKSRQALDATRRAAHKGERAAMWEAGAALREAFFGNAREAKQHAAAALDFSKGRAVKYGVAFALALGGDTVQSQAVAKDLERASEDTYDRFVNLPTLRALWALNYGASANAVEALLIAAPYEMA